jgi:hypothetical protein
MNISHLPGINKIIAASIFFLLFSLLQFPLLKAQNALPDSVVKERTQHIQNMLNEGKPAADLWWNGWLYGYSAATIVQGAVAFTTDKLETRQDMALGAVTTLVGAIGQLVMPMTPLAAPAKLVSIPGETPEERIKKLKYAEALFEASANREKDGCSWQMHAASSAVNMGSGLITWLGFNRTIQSGLINFAINEVITEAQIWTQPTRAIKDYQKYREKYINCQPSCFYKPKPQLFVSAFPGGLALKLVF